MFTIPVVAIGLSIVIVLIICFARHSHTSKPVKHTQVMPYVPQSIGETKRILEVLAVSEFDILSVYQHCSSNDNTTSCYGYVLHIEHVKTKELFILFFPNEHAQILGIKKLNLLDRVYFQRYTTPRFNLDELNPTSHIEIHTI